MLKQMLIPPLAESISFFDKTLFTKASRLARIAFVSSSCFFLSIIRSSFKWRLKRIRENLKLFVLTFENLDFVKKGWGRKISLW